MKILDNKFTLLVLFVLLFNSCSSDDDNSVKKSDYTFTGVCESSILLNGFANQQTTSIESSIPLDNMLRNYDYVPPVTSAIFLTNATIVQINGMKDGMVLDNFSLRMNGEEYKFGTVTYRDTVLYTQNAPQTVNYFKGAFDRMVKQQEQITSATFTPNQTIDKKTGVKVSIALGGAFTYWK